MKLLGNTKSKITKDKKGDTLPHLEITEVVLVRCSIVNSDYQQGSRVLYKYVPNKSFWSINRYFTKKFYIFKKPLIQNFHILKYGLLIRILNH